VAVLAAAPLPTGADDGPSCTFVAGVWDGEEVTVGSVGDSRAYWLGRTTSLRLTADDSWAQEQVDAGTMTEPAAMSAPDAHVITRWLGPDAPEGPYRVHALRPREPGRLILCSDGLWQYASSPAELRELVEILLPVDDPAALARDLVQAACGLGGGDNVTVAVIVVDPDHVRQEETA
jgi:serine/threonine protein phosphatase PrpC